MVAAPIEMIGTFVVPPPAGRVSRDFQTLHFDFGVPHVPFAAADVARLKALHVPAWVSSAQALTRFVGLRPLLSGHTWPGLEELVRRFVAYGASHGAWQPDTGYAEGSLARVIEAALGQPPALPSVSANPDFLRGTESPPSMTRRYFSPSGACPSMRWRLRFVCNPASSYCSTIL